MSFYVILYLSATLIADLPNTLTSLSAINHQQKTISYPLFFTKHNR